MTRSSEQTAQREHFGSWAWSSAWPLIAAGVAAGCGTDAGAVFGSSDEVRSDAGEIVVGSGGHDATGEGGSAAATGGGGSGAEQGSGGMASAGRSATGGAPHSGGTPNPGGASSTGGSPAAGGAKNSGGSADAGGKSNAGGAINSGGASGTSGASNTGGASGAGGRIGAGGSAGMAGTAGSLGAGGARPVCVGAPPSCGSLGQTECATVAGCASAGMCRATPSMYCASYPRADTCNKAMGCAWNGTSGCQGASSECGPFATAIECAKSGCTWAVECRGTPTPCNAFDLSDCANHPGCSLPFRWQP